MAFVERALTLIFTLGNNGTFAEGQNQLKVEGVRAKVRIEKNSGGNTSHANMTVYGLTMPHMRALAALNPAFMVMKQNVVEILANDITNPASQPTSVFIGQITEGEIDITNEPESALVLTAVAGLYYSVAPAAGSSYTGLTQVTVILDDIAKKMNLTLNSSGLSKPYMLSDPHLFGTLMTQAQSICEAWNLNLFIDGKTMYVYDRYGYVTVGTDASIPVVSAETGMIGYPTFSDHGFFVHTLFSPFLNMGQRVEVRSTLEYANGTFSVYQLVNELESQVPDGKWETSFHCNWADYALAPR
jgi:hypothetical protein